MSPCILWNGARSGSYGSIGAKARPHRLIYELTKGEIPRGFHIHHSCRNKLCINPEHLIAVSETEHRHLHRQAFCKRGHPLTDDNVYIRPDNGKRRCLTCIRERNPQRRLGPFLMTCVICGKQEFRKQRNARVCSQRCLRQLRKRSAA